MALNPYGRANRPDRAHFITAGLRLGLRERAIISTIVGTAGGCSRLA